MRRGAVSALISALVISMIVLLTPSTPANATPVAQQQSFVLAAATSSPPTGDCITMATLILSGLAIRAGAAAYTVGEGAIYANASSLIGDITGIAPTYHCLNYVVPAYVSQICWQSHQGLFSYKTLWARILILFATRGHRSTC